MSTIPETKQHVYRTNKPGVLVSVIIPTYERFDEVQQAINSVLDQTIAKYTEIIVVDDCSSDPRYLTLGTLYANRPNVILVRMSKNSREIAGTSSAHGLTKNLGLEVAGGEWIAFLDDDDVYISPEKLESQIIHAQSNNALMSSTNMLTSNMPYRYRPNSTLYFWEFNYGVMVKTGVYKIGLVDIQDCNLINNSTVILHKSIVEKTGLFSVCQYEDWDYWKRAMVHTDCVYLHKPTVYYNTGTIKMYKNV